MRGGLQLAAHKQSSAAAPIVQLPKPREAVLPVDQHAGGALTPCVRTGDRVRIGQVIAVSEDPYGASLHAPISGELVVEPRPSPQARSGHGLAIVIHNDGDERADFSAEATPNWRQMSPAHLCRRIAQGGSVGLGGATFSTAKKLLAPQGIEHLLLNGVECEPYITCDDRLMRERAALVVCGAQIAMHACGAQRCTIAIETDKPEALRAMHHAVAVLRDDRITVSSVEIGYPTGDEGQLMQILLGREIPRGGLPADVGVICQNVGTAAAIAQWIESGVPLISRIVTITGAGVAEPGNVEASLGTSFAEIIAACGGYTDAAAALVMGGSMMGLALPNDAFPLVKATNCIIAATPAELYSSAPELPCIRCGDCMDVCPVGLLPQQLHAQILNGNAVALAELGLQDCIECGCCDYVCPSHIPLAQRFRLTKRARA